MIEKELEQKIDQHLSNGEGEQSLIELAEVVREYTEVLTHCRNMPIEYLQEVKEAEKFLKMGIGKLKVAKLIADEEIGREKWAREYFQS